MELIIVRSLRQSDTSYRTGNRERSRFSGRIRWRFRGGPGGIAVGRGEVVEVKVEGARWDRELWGDLLTASVKKTR